MTKVLPPLEVNLDTNVRDSIASWQSFFDYEAFVLQEFKQITPRHASEISLELKDYVVKMREDLSHSLLKKNLGVLARIHVLDSEIKRLYDMSLIKVIGPEETQSQVVKIASVHSGLLAHINFVFQQKAFEQRLDLDSLFVVNEKQQSKKRKVKINKNRRLRTYGK